MRAETKQLILNPPPYPRLSNYIDRILYDHHNLDKLHQAQAGYYFWAISVPTMKGWKSGPFFHNTYYVNWDPRGERYLRGKY